MFIFLLVAYNEIILFIEYVKFFVYCLAYCVLGIYDLPPTIVVKHMWRKNSYLYMCFV
jgi:hypothetical protein